MSHERYLSTDLHFLIAIVVWGESLNNFENFNVIYARIFSQKKSHEKLFFKGSTFRDSSRGTKLK